MTVIKPFEGFDKYGLQARIYPALITLSPGIASAFLLWPKEIPQQAAVALLATGGAFLTANIVRSLGKSLESRLVEIWNGLPTVHMLRHKDNPNPHLLHRRREALQKITGMRFPTESKEQQDPKKADQMYIAATRVLITRVRSNKERYNLVHEENISYGFRRNLLALKPLGTSIALLSMAGILAWWFINGAVTHQLFAALIVNVAMLAVWAFLIKPAWVWQAGEAYAERLFDTLEDPMLLAPESGNSETGA